MRNPLKLLAPHNPCLFIAKGNGNLIATDQNGDFSLTSSGALRYQAAQGARINLCFNPRLAVDAFGWVPTAGTVSRIDGDGVSGGQSAEISATNQNGGAYLTCVSPYVGNGQTVTISFSAKLVGGPSDWGVYRREMSASKAFIANSVAFSFTPTANWQRFSFTTTTNQTGVHVVSPYFYRQSATPGVIRVTDVVIEYGGISNPTYFDGSTGGVWLDPITGQLGTAHASPSVSQAAFWVEEATTNLLLNPSLEGSIGAETSQRGTGAAQTQDSAYAYLGAKSHKVVGNGTSSIGGNYKSATGLGLTGAANPYVGQIVLRSPTNAQVQVFTSVRYTDATFVDSATITVTLNDQWQRIVTNALTLNAAKTVDYLFVYWNTVSAASSDTVYADCAQVEQKAYATSYCDGSLGTGFSWSGTANASSSTRAATTVKFDEANRVLPNQGAIVMFAQRNVDAGALQYLFQTGDNASGKDRITLYADTDDALKLGMLSQPSANVVASSGVSMTVGAWLSAYGDWTASQQRAAVGATMVSAVRNPPNNVIATANDAAIGTPNTASTNAFNGALGPVAIFSRPLTDAELAKVIALGPSLAFDSLKALA